MNDMATNKAIKASKWSAILTLVGFLIVAGAIAFSSVSLNRLDNKIAEKKQALDSEIAEKQRMSARLEGDISRKKEEIARMEGELGKTNTQLQRYYKVIKSASANKNLGADAQEKKALDEIVKPRVHIHSRFQPKLAKQIAEKLQEEGYLVDREDILFQNGRTTPYVGFFRTSEEDEAIAITIFKILKEELNINDVKLIPLDQSETSKAIIPQHFEISLDDISANNVASKSDGGKNSWDWTVFIEAPDCVLKQVKSVEYTLHRTFPDPIRTVSSRGNGKHAFPLEATGWGVFQIKISVSLKNGNVLPLTHYLNFQGG